MFLQIKQIQQFLEDLILAHRDDFGVAYTITSHPFVSLQTTEPNNISPIQFLQMNQHVLGQGKCWRLIVMTVVGPMMTLSSEGLTITRYQH